MPLPVNASLPSTLVKTATQIRHAEVEELLLPALAAIRSTAGYAAILKMFYGFFSPLENLIANHLTTADLPDLDERRKANRILHDLALLRYPVQGLPLCRQLPAINHKAQAFGALYVLEGSTLGGKMIARMLLANEQAAIPQEALSFFSGYKEQTGRRWNLFLEAFNCQYDTDSLVQAANDTFFYLKCWMEHTLNHE